MPDFVTLSCPTCGGQLQITQDIDRFACAHCGNEHMVNRGGGIITLAPVVAGLDGIRRGTDRTAAELTIRRLKEELAEQEQELQARAQEVCMGDPAGIRFSLMTLGKRGRLDYEVPPGAPKSETGAKYNREFIVQLSADMMAELCQAYQEKRRKYRAKPECVAAFNTLIGLKRQIEDTRSKIEELKQA